MGLEHWDPSRGKFVLYRTTEQHAADCDHFPFESIPRRVFLDTNVINVLVKHSAHVFDQDPIPLDTESTLAADIEALMHVFYVGARANWCQPTSGTRPFSTLRTGPPLIVSARLAAAACPGSA